MASDSTIFSLLLRALTFRGLIGFERREQGHGAGPNTNHYQHYDWTDLTNTKPIRALEILYV
jgi:hypothetical protein